MSIVFKNECASCIDTPLENKTTMYVDNCDGAVKVMDNSWCVNTISCAANLTSLAQCCDIPTNNISFTNWCWFFKWYWWVPFNCSLCNHRCFIAPATWLMIWWHNEYGSDAHWICDYTTWYQCNYTFPKNGWLVMPVVQWHCYCSWWWQSNANFSVLSWVLVFCV